MKKVLIMVFVLLGLFGFIIAQGFRLTIAGAMNGDVKVIRSEDIGDYGKAALFEDQLNDTFGVAKIEKKYGFLYRNDGSTFGYQVEEGKPFQAAGIGDPEDFLVAVKTAESSNIKYIAIGNTMGIQSPFEPYQLSLDEVRANPDEYHLKEVTDHYVLFVLDENTEDNWTIRAFNDEGDLIADKIFGAKERYIDWE